MYEQFYGLSERPFDLAPNPRYLVLTSDHREALSNLEYGVGNRTGITLLLGEAGTGKTTVIRAAIERLPTPTHCIYLDNPALTRVEFVRMLAAQFSLSEHARTSKADLLLELEQLFRQRSNAGERTVLIVDEAQSLPLLLLEEIRLLSNLGTNDKKLLSIVIAAQPELATRLSQQSLRQLKQRIALRWQLRPLAMSECGVYISSRIGAAGGVPAEMFTREAVTLIHEFSRGVPRTINVIADNALLGGFARGQRLVTGTLVREVCRDFDIARPPAAPQAATRRESPPVVLRVASPPSPAEHRSVETAVPTSQQRLEEQIVDGHSASFSVLGLSDANQYNSGNRREKGNSMGRVADAMRRAGLRADEPTAAGADTAPLVSGKDGEKEVVIRTVNPSALKAPAPGYDWQTLWFATRQKAWSSLAIVPSDVGIDVERVAAQLVATGQLHGERPVSLMNAQGIRLGDVQPFIDRLLEMTGRGEWVIIAVDPLPHNASGLPIARAASHALLVVTLGQSMMSSARDVIKALGREHLLGSVVVEDVARG